MTPTKKRGGRQHGLNDVGKARALNLTLGDAALLATLAELSATHGLSQSEVVRRLVLHRGASTVVGEGEAGR